MTEASQANQRLHPMSWLFVLLQQLKQFILPLVAAFFFGGDRNELWPLIGVGALALLSVWRYYTYHYGVVDETLVVRSGLLERSLRVIPFARIHNVALQQSALHRLFGVAEVRLESAGGEKPEAEMRVLKLSDALALDALVRRRGRASTADTAAAEQAPAVQVLLQLPTSEVLRQGLVSNRGLVVAAAGVAGTWQFGGDKLASRLVQDFLQQWVEKFNGYSTQQHFGAIQYALAGLLVVGTVMALLRVFSMLLALLQYHGFVLNEEGRRLTVERGLLGRWRTTSPRRRIQAWTLHEGLMHRLLRRRTLEVDTAGAGHGRNDQRRALHDIAPVASPATCDALIEHLLPRSGWSQLAWQSLPQRQWWRLMLFETAAVVVAVPLLSWQLELGAYPLALLLWLPWAAFKARHRLAHAAYVHDARLVGVREGWLRRHWRFAEIDKLQTLQLTRNPVDRRCGTATLWLDTAGANPMAPPLRIRFLPEEQARRLHERLARTLARRPLHW
ncbi:PH domain-containing protein [Lysobacter fragariae]